MEMKLNPQRVKSLRLNRSWSQEQLAEEAGLNPRTIQRVETEGGASLSTRLRIAKALEVEPSELDMPAVTKDRASAPSEVPAVIPEFPHPPGRIAEPRFAYHLPVLLLISLVYLAWTPIYFSLSRGNFQAMGPEDWSHLWVPVILGFWFSLALPWMVFVYFRRRPRLWLHTSYLGALVFFSVLRAMQEEVAMSVLSFALYLSGLALLYTCHRESEHRGTIRHLSFILIAAYLFVWLVQQPLSGYMVGGYFRWEQGLDVPLPWISFPRFVLRLLGQATQLFPLALVVLFDLGKPTIGSAQRRLADHLSPRLCASAGE